MLKLIAIVYVWAAMIFVVLARAFDAVVKAPSRYLIEFRGWSIPASLLRVACGHRRAVRSRM
jgi:hypothetical protein